ncbi:MAG: GNAT family N-acetyltransferase [Candidatus Latescibacteria bacterium]|nr:GNAT family N-acetyltransferase [Candidatus Latescibacterota bacterium]
MRLIFQTERLFFRRCRPSDFDALEPILSDPPTMRLMGTGQPQTDAEIRGFLDFAEQHHREYGFGPGLLVDKETNAVIGDAGLVFHDQSQQVAEVYYVLSRPMWNKGLATEFCQAAVDFLLARPDVGSVRATAMPENTASVRMLEKSGFLFQHYNQQANRRVYTIDRAAVLTAFEDRALGQRQCSDPSGKIS